MRSLATAIFTRGWALADLWIFIVFPILGGVLAGMVARSLQNQIFNTNHKRILIPFWILDFAESLSAGFRRSDFQR
ncbi:hypothetical protein [Calothrix sp. PCC 7507]|uniref:hypothetical protein n=1 Tax=Calothrix sp. PCC 7507 TaxID=99598 RepID=UPI0002E6B41D|nr:hypothetical protein [Calothrix sp. PCC 7507]